MKNIFIAQSGGPTAAINASLAGVLDSARRTTEFDVVYGALNGITGILEERFLNLTEKYTADPSFIEKLKVTPAMYLGSCRYKLPTPEEDITPYELIFETFKKMDIAAFFYIGGNDSMDTVLKLSKYADEINSPVKILGIPKTIDNDLMHTDHTPGFGSAAKYIASSMLEIAHDTMIYHVKSVTIAEIMGRDAGWLTASSALARNSYSNAPQLIYLPEKPFIVGHFLQDVHKLLDKQDNVLVAVSEGIRSKDGNYISAGVSTTDTFGHTQLSGAGKALELLLKEAFPVKVRSIEINILQRCAGHMASACDLSEAFALGSHALNAAVEGITGHMVTIERKSDDPYETSISTFPIENIANGVKSVPLDMINEEGNDITPKMLRYLSPLIQGETSLSYTKGLPEYLDISHLKKI